MLPKKKIEPPDWMTDYRAATLMRVLGGFEKTPQALFVGGCVRNTLLGCPVNDVDIATVHDPLHVIEKLTSAGIRFVPTGLDHGTVTAVIDEKSFEITTLRKDIETDGRHAVIAFTTEWPEDALRRDFTMNTLLASAEGDIFDPTERGLEDLEARKVVFVGEPADRIAEDYLRILRFFRFHAQYGEGEADAAALRACKEASSKIEKLSRERITQEFIKILQTAKAAGILRLMFSCGVLSPMGGKFNAESLQSLCDLQQKFEAYDVMARLFSLAGMKENDFGKFLVLSNAQKRHLEMLVAGIKILKSISRKKMRELVYRVGNAAALQAYFLKLAANNDFPDLEIIDIARYWQAPEFPVRGEDLIEAGILPGPLLGKTLKAQEDKWISKDFPADFVFKK